MNDDPLPQLTNSTLMKNLHPATQLLIIQSLFLLLGAPAMAWFSVVVGKADRAARWWYAGLALLGVSAPEKM